MRINMKKILLPIALVATLAVAWSVNYNEIRRPYTLEEVSLQHEPGEMFYFTPKQADAQVAGSITGAGAWGYMIPVFNVQADTTIFAGSVVCWDTTATIKKAGVKLYSGTLSDRKKVAGIAVGDIQRAQLGNGRGTILVWGYSPSIKSSTSDGIVAGSPFRVSTVNGAMVNAGDSLSMQAGYCTGGVAGTYQTTSRIKGYVTLIGGSRTVLIR